MLCYFQYVIFSMVSVACSILHAVYCLQYVAVLESWAGGLKTRVVIMTAEFSTVIPWEARLDLFIGFDRKPK